MKKAFLILVSTCLLVVGCKSNSNNSDNNAKEESMLALSGNGTPSSTTGNNLDLYIDTDTLNVYCKESDKWIPSETITTRKIVNKYVNDDASKKMKYLANAFYSSNIVVDFEMEGNGIFTHEIATFKGGVLINEVYTSKDAYNNKDKNGGYYQYQKFSLENGKHYAEIQGGEKQEINESSFYYGMAATSFDKTFSSQLNCNSLAKELFDILDGTKEALSFTVGETSIVLSNFLFTFNFKELILESMTFKNTQYSIDYKCQFSNYGKVE